MRNQTFTSNNSDHEQVNIYLLDLNKNIIFIKKKGFFYKHFLYINKLTYFFCDFRDEKYS